MMKYNISLTEKLIVAQIVIKLIFYGAQRFIPCSQETAAGHQPELYKLSPYLQTPYLLSSILSSYPIDATSRCPSVPSDLFPLDFSTKIL
jgi:hypothetical protein